MRRLSLALAVLLFAADSVRAAGGAGSTSLEFLTMGVGARYVAMGQTAAAVVDDSNAMFWNPAGLARMKSPSASFMYGAYVASLQQQSLSIAAPTGLGTFGLSAQTLIYPSIRRTDDTGRELGRFSPVDTAYAVGWSHTLGRRLAFGVAGKMVQSKIVDTAAAMAADAGISYQRLRWGAALSVRNVGQALQFDREASPLPRSLRIGSSWRPKLPWIVALDADVSQEAGNAFSLGSEYKVFSSVRGAFFLRAGYLTRTEKTSNTLGISAGWGWRWETFDMDYAWVPMGDFDAGQTHRLSLTLRFGRQRLW